MSRFLDITATGTRWTGNLIWLWIQRYNICIFDAMVWTIHLCGHLSGRAYTYLHGQCNVDGCLGQEGVWKYTGLCQAIVLDASRWWWIHPWIHVEMDGLCWTDLFWTSLICGWGMMYGFQGFLEACILHEILPSINNGWGCFCAKQRLLKTGFGELRNLMWIWWRWFLPFAWQFGMSFIVFACACSTTNSKPFSTWFYFNNFVDEKFCGIGFMFLLHVSDWKACFLENVMFIFQQRLHGRVFHWNWMTSFSEFDAPARCTSTR